MKIPLPRLIPHAENSLVVSGGNRKHNISVKFFKSIYYYVSIALPVDVSVLLCLLSSEKVTPKYVVSKLPFEDRKEFG